ncbi:MAG: hypothetical protein AB1941_14515 [Gemmatimonadota bacterium]
MPNSIQLRRVAVGALAGLMAAAAGACDKSTTAVDSSARSTASVDSAAILAGAGNTMLAASYGEIPVPAGARVTVTVSYVQTARCEIISVSGVIKQTVFPQGVGGCGRGAIESDGLGLSTMIGPAATSGNISFRMSSSGGSTVSGSAPNYTVSLYDAVGDDSDDVVLSVKVEAANSNLECLPASVQRGEIIRCTLTVAEAYRVLTRESQGRGFRITETPGTSHATGETYVWEGPAVADSRVTVRVESAGKQQSHSTSFKVTERQWATPGFSNIVTVVGLDPSQKMRPYPSNGMVGGSHPNPDASIWGRLPVSRPTQGPNTGLGFLADPLPDFPWKVYLHPALYPPPAGLQPGQPGYEQWHRWYDDQDGRGSGTCTPAVFAILVPEVERHEGVAQASDSHYGVAIKAYTDLKPQQRYERLYTDEDDYALRALVYDEWRKFHEGGQYQTRQNAFDNTDYPKVLSRLGCTLDFNPSDR